jgi:hypothetical protein
VQHSLLHAEHLRAAAAWEDRAGGLLRVAVHQACWLAVEQHWLMPERSA